LTINWFAIGIALIVYNSLLMLFSPEETGMKFWSVSKKQKITLYETHSIHLTICNTAGGNTVIGIHAIQTRLCK